MNKMQEIRISKVVINIGCGEAGVKLDKAKKLLFTLVNQKIFETKTHKRTTFGMPKKRAIGCKVTLRGEKAIAFLKRALDAVDFKLSKNIFDTQGNFSFGIKEHIDLHGVKYDPDLGIFGMDVCIVLERPGFRVLRKFPSSKISKKHKITPDEAEKWLTKTFNVKVE